MTEENSSEIDEIEDLRKRIQLCIGALGDCFKFECRNCGAVYFTRRKFITLLSIGKVPYLYCGLDKPQKEKQKDKEEKENGREEVVRKG